MNIKRPLILCLSAILLSSCGRTIGDLEFIVGDDSQEKDKIVNNNSSEIPSSISSVSSLSESTNSEESIIIPIEQFTVSFNSNGGSQVESQIVEKGSKVQKPSDPTKNAYSFIDWKYKESIWEFDKNVVNEDMILTASWNPIVYSISYELDGGENNSSNPTSYTIENPVSLSGATKEGYSFDGWYVGEEQIETIEEGTYGDITLTAHWVKNSYSVIAISEDASKGSVSGSGAYEYESTVTVNAVPNNGYAFEGWYEAGEKVSSSAIYEFFMNASDVSLEARFSAITYSIAYELNGGVNSEWNPLTYTIEDNILLCSPEKDYHTFAGWYIDEVKVTEINAGTFGDLTLVAHWDPLLYTITLDNRDPEWGTVSGAGNYAYGTNVTITAIPNYGYDIDMWFQDSEIITSEYSFNYTMGSTDVIFSVYFEPKDFCITYELDGGVNDVNNQSWFYYNTGCSLHEPTREGYIFEGWYNGSTKVESIAPNTYGDITLTAHWTKNSYSVSVISEDTSKGTVSGGGTYEYESNVTVIASPNAGYLFEGWFSDSQLTQMVSNNASYSFTMLAYNITLYAKFEIDIREWNINHGVIPTISQDGKTITYGMYPQTNVNNSSLVEVLDSLADPNEYGYYFYNNEYYFKYSATPYESGYTFDNGTTIVSGTTYWFKVEPIKWKVLENNDGEYFITTESILTNHRYNSFYKETQSMTDYQGNTDTVYASNYKYSEIRSWLNTDFYSQAFFLDDDNIKVSQVDNSVSSTLYSVNSYVCEDTNDKLFLLSAKELTTASYGFDTSASSSDSARQCKTTDYARAHGVYHYSSNGYVNIGAYYTRSPYYNESNKVGNFYTSCGVRLANCYGDVNSFYALYYPVCGVRLALRLSLDK